VGKKQEMGSTSVQCY